MQTAPSATDAAPEPSRLFSVVINNYNYLRFLPQAIASIQNQTFRDFELIVVDDGSDDGSLEYLKSREGEFTLVLTKRLKQARACLAGIARATGRYVYILDADDIAMSDLLATAAARVGDSPAKIQFRLVPVREDGVQFAPAYPDIRAEDDDAAQREQIRRTGMPHSPPTSGNIFRRDLFAVIGDVAYEGAIDGAVLLYSPFAGKVVSLPVPLAYYRVHDHADSAHAAPLDPDRIRRDRHRFEDRLAHLGAILALHRPDEAPVPAAASYFFYWDLVTVECVATEQSIGLRVAASYVWRLVHEYGASRFTCRKLAWLMIAALAPRRLKNRVLVERRNPWPRRARGSLSV